MEIKLKGLSKRKQALFALALYKEFNQQAWLDPYIDKLYDYLENGNKKKLFSECSIINSTLLFGDHSCFYAVETSCYYVYADGNDSNYAFWLYGLLRGKYQREPIKLKEIEQQAILYYGEINGIES